ncbi:UDP-N-acetylmuramoyl-L-alanine--D-glutamate ligase [Methylolobus aquaticus]|nr:UDP-N-acetylmuramoyl-L-alanine--D-glutamate ligase [Methylolobus aquaticus]
MTRNLTDSRLAAAGLSPDSRALIVGLGKTGLSVARFLAGKGIRFAVVDSRSDPPGLNALREAFPDVGVFLGDFAPAAFAAATHLIVNPGVALDIPPIAAAAARGARVLGDVDLFACCANAPVVGITGSNGKSTVTALLGLMAERDQRRVRVGGNLGEPMLDLLDDEAELYVLELSSFQLERSSLLEPLAATVLNVTPDHMDRYADLEGYAAAKARIFNGNGVMVLTQDDPIVAGMAQPGRRVVWFGLNGAADFRLQEREGEVWLTRGEQFLMPAGEVRIRGQHNLSNALAALALGTAAGLSEQAMADALRVFPGLEHRMQWVAERHGVTYVNDSKATNVGACLAALSGLTGKAVLIAGGDGKGADFSILRDAAARHLRAAVLMGKDAALLQSALGDVVPVSRVNTMHEAVGAAAALAQDGDTVLLAPACASLDQYRDYQHRGQVFVEAVRSLPT